MDFSSITPSSPPPLSEHPRSLSSTENQSAKQDGEKRIDFNKVVNPQDFYCPIQETLMTNPVLLSCGHSFEETAIKAWFDKNRKRICPTCLEEDKNSKLPTNRYLLDHIRQWEEVHPEEAEEVEEVEEAEEAEESLEPPTQLAITQEEVNQHLEKIKSISQEGQPAQAINMLLDLQEKYPEQKDFAELMDSLLGQSKDRGPTFPLNRPPPNGYFAKLPPRQAPGQIIPGSVSPLFRQQGQASNGRLAPHAHPMATPILSGVQGPYVYAMPPLLPNHPSQPQQLPSPIVKNNEDKVKEHLKDAQDRLKDIQNIFKEGRQGIAIGMLLDLQEKYPDYKALPKIIEIFLNRVNHPQPAMPNNGLQVPSVAPRQVPGQVVQGAVQPRFHQRHGGLPAPLNHPQPAMPHNGLQVPLVVPRQVPGQPIYYLEPQQQLPPRMDHGSIESMPIHVPFGSAPFYSLSSPIQVDHTLEKEHKDLDVAAPHRGQKRMMTTTTRSSHAPIQDQQTELDELERSPKRLKGESEGKVQEIFNLLKIASLQHFKTQLTPETVNAVDSKGNTLLHQVVLERREFKFIDTLIALGLPIDQVNLVGNTALHLAVELRSPRYIKGLIRRGADVTITNLNGKTPRNMSRRANIQKIFQKQKEIDVLALELEEEMKKEE